MQTSPYQAVFTSDIQIIPRRHPYARQSLLQRFRLSHADIPVPGSLHLKDLEYPMHPRTRQPSPGRFRLKDLHRPNQPSARQPGIVTWKIQIIPISRIPDMHHLQIMPANPRAARSYRLKDLDCPSPPPPQPPWTNSIFLKCSYHPKTTPDL